MKLEDLKNLINSFAHKVIFEKDNSQMNNYFEVILSGLKNLEDCKHEIDDSNNLKSISFYQLDEDDEKDYLDYELSLYKSKTIENQTLYTISVTDEDLSFEFGGFVNE